MAAFLAGARRFIHRKPRWMSLFSFTTTKHSPVLIGGFTFTAISSLSVPIFSVVLGEIFNTFTSFGGGKIAKQDLTPQISKYAVQLVGLGAINWVCNSIYFILFVIFGELQVANARTKLFERLLQKSQEWFETQPDGTRVFLSSLQGQIDDLQKATSQPLGLALQYIFRAIFSLALAFLTSWNLTLVTLAGIPFLSAALSFLSTKTNSCMEAQKTELGHLSLIVDNTTSSIDSVKSFNGQDTEMRNFVSSVDNAALHYLKRARFTSLQISILRLMTFGMFVQGFWYGSSLATSGVLSAGEVLRTFWACLAAAQSMEFLMPQIVVLAKGKDAALSLIHALNSESEDTVRGEGRGSVYPKFCEGDIEVSNVSFAYPSQPKRPVLNSTSFFFPAGETTFVIGRSGSGKSTLGQLLTRFYLPVSGEILIDGVPIQSLSIDWIRNNITLLEQRSVLFNESIFMNVAFGSRNFEGLNKVDVRECIDLARLQSTIDDLPKGIDTCVGHGGDFLSGGQKQRVAIARARLRDTPILIMDEPTSALDATNRVEITKAIREWRRGKTTIIITHDMSQIMDHDFAYVMDQGSVVQAGYRHELEESNTYFATSDKRYRDESDDVGAHSSSDRYSNVPSESSAQSLRGPSPDSFSRHKELAQHSYAIHDYKASIQSIRQSADTQRVRSRRESIGMQMFELNTVHVNDASVQSNRYSSILPVNDVVNEINTARSKHRTKRSFNNAARLAPQERMSLGQIMLTILPNLTRGQKLLLLLGCFSTLGHSMATPLFSYCLSKLLESFYDEQAKASTWSLIVLGIAIGDGVISYLMHYLLELCGQAWVDRLRKRGFRHILDQPRKWFEGAGNEPSQLTTSLNNSAEEMRNLVGHFGGYVLVATSVTVVAIIWCMAVCWKLTLVAVACGPVIYAITRGLEKTTGIWERRCTGVKTTASEIFIETFSQIRTVRTLTLEPYFHKKHMKAAALCMVLGVKKAVYTGFLFGLVESMIIFVSSLIFYYGAVLVSSLEFTVTSLMTVFSVLLFSIGYASTVLSWIPQISVSHIMANQVLRLAHLPQGASHEHRGNLKITTAAPVKIKNLNFRYPSRPDAHVLRDVSINIPRNQCTAIVGRSGSGKSTIASLLLGLYKAPTSQAGSSSPITLNGIDIQRIHTPTLRSLISIVSQRPTIFPGTVADNISYGLEDDSPLRTMFHIRAAAEAAGIDEFITSLPKGYFTLIGDGGAGMSGGQAQRLVIARALVRQPQVLILDEATSSLDPNNAKIIRRTVQRLVTTRLGLTVLIITHARDMMEIADNIIVIDKGRVVEAGAYKQLARQQNGKLRALIEDPDSDGDETGI